MHFRFTWFKAFAHLCYYHCAHHFTLHVYTSKIYIYLKMMCTMFWWFFFSFCHWFWVFVFALFSQSAIIDARAFCTRSQSNTRCVNNIVYKKLTHILIWQRKEWKKNIHTYNVSPEGRWFRLSARVFTFYRSLLSSLSVCLPHLVANWLIQTRSTPISFWCAYEINIKK